MSPKKLLLVAFVIAILLIPAYNYDVKKVEAQPSVSVVIKSKYPAPHNTTFWLHSSGPMYFDAHTGLPVYDKETGYIIVKSLGGFNGSISFSFVPISWPAAGLQVSLPPSTYLPAGGTLTLTFNITTVSTVPAGTYTFRIRVTSGASNFDSNVGSVSVMTSALPLFRLKGYPYIIATAAGTTLTVPYLVISRAGYVGTTALSGVYYPHFYGNTIPFNPTGFSVYLDAPDPLYNGGLLTAHGIFEAKLKIDVASTVTPSVYYVYAMGYYSDYIFNGDFNPVLAKVVGGTLYPLGWNYTANVDLSTTTWWTFPYSARLTAPTTAYSGVVRLYQKIWLPTTSPSYWLSFYYYITTADNPGDDVVRFRIYNTTNYMLYEAVVPAANYTATWRSFSVNLATVPSVMAYKGKDIIISFEVAPDADFLATTAYVDYIRFPGFVSGLVSYNAWGFILFDVRVVDMLVTQTSPVAPPIPYWTEGFEGFPLGSLLPATLTVGAPAPSYPAYWGTWQGKASTYSTTYQPPTYQWFSGIVTTNSPSSGYDQVYEGARAARLGATPNHPTSGSSHIYGWEILRSPQVTIPNVPGTLALQFYMYTDSQEGSASSADFWDPTYVTFRATDTSDSPFVITPSGASCTTATTLPCYYTINSANSWQNWALYTFTIPDWMKGQTVFISIEMAHRDPLFRTWHLFDNFAIAVPGGPLQDISMVTGSFRITGQIGPNENVNPFVTGEGYYGGNVYIFATISPLIPFTSYIFAQGPVANLMYNGDFELGTLDGWDVLTDVSRTTPAVTIVQNFDPAAPGYEPANVISGRYSAKILYDSFDTDYESMGYTTLYTTVPVYISPYATSATLSFKYRTSSSPGGGIIFDWVVEVIDANTGRLLASFFPSLPSTTLQTYTIDLSPYKGNNLIFRFRVGEFTLFGVTAVYLDDVVVNAPTPSINQVFIASATDVYPFDALIGLPSILLGSQAVIPPGIYNVTLIFIADPPYAPAVESGAIGPVKTLLIKLRVIGVEPVEVPEKITTSGEFDIKLRFTTADADNLNRTLTFESYDIWVSSSSYESGTFTPFDRATAAKEFGLWIKWDGGVNRKMSFALPGKGGSAEVTLRLVTQNAKPGTYALVFFVTSNITANGAIPATVWEFNPPPPPGNWLYRTFVGTPVAFNVIVGDYSISTDTYTLVVPSTGTAEFNVKVKTYATPFTLSFSGKAYRVELGQVVETRGVSFSFEPSTVTLGPDKEATIKVTVTTNLATLGLSYIDITATDGTTTRTIQGIKLFVVPGGGSIQEVKGTKGEVKTLSSGESIVKKLPTYEFTVDNNNKIIKEYKPISIASDNIREVNVVSGYASIPLNAIALVIATLAAIGVAVFIARKYL